MWCEHCGHSSHDCGEAEERKRADGWWAETLESWKWDKGPLYIAACLREWWREINPYSGLDPGEDDELIKAWLKRIEKKFGEQSRKEVEEMLYQIDIFDGRVELRAPEFGGWGAIDAEYIENGGDEDGL